MDFDTVKLFKVHDVADAKPENGGQPQIMEGGQLQIK